MINKKKTKYDIYIYIYICVNIKCLHFVLAADLTMLLSSTALSISAATVEPAATDGDVLLRELAADSLLRSAAAPASPSPMKLPGRSILLASPPLAVAPDVAACAVAGAAADAAAAAAAAPGTDLPEALSEILLAPVADAAVAAVVGATAAAGAAGGVAPALPLLADVFSFAAASSLRSFKCA